VISIVGGAIAAPFMGNIADLHSMRIGFVVPRFGLFSWLCTA